MRTLEGAVFELYEDTNGNQEFDEEDQLIGELTEANAGLHTAENLLAKGYFIKESQAPEGYELDENAYYFQISEDGQTVVVENGEAGCGFTNEAQRGNLKITKDSSDGRKDGFAIKVKSADGTYCETFTTPEDGIIEVNGLRVGVYTVTEQVIDKYEPQEVSSRMQRRWRLRQMKQPKCSCSMRSRRKKHQIIRIRQEQQEKAEKWCRRQVTTA